MAVLSVPARGVPLRSLRVSVPIFNPMNLSPALWLDASQESGSDGAAILPTDKSGNGVAISQATSGNRPTIEVAEINGLNSFGWNGTSQFLDAALSAAVLPFAGFAVVKATSFATARAVMRTNTAGQGVSFQVVQTTGTIRALLDAETANVSTSVVTAGTAIVLACKVDVSGNYSYWFNGVKDATTGTFTDTSPAAANVRIAATSVPNLFMLGQMPEVIRYHTLLTDAQMAQASLYLKTKWGIA